MARGGAAGEVTCNDSIFLSSSRSLFRSARLTKNRISSRGIDVGAKAEIYRLLENLVEQGAGVLMISSELPEVVAVCDRVYVMRDKTIVGELGRRDLTEENILKAQV